MTTGMFTPGSGSVNAQRVRLSHNRAAIRHMHGDGAAQLCAGVTLACRDTPLPPLEAYEAWFAAQAVRASRYFLMDARKVRRIAQMRRNGCTFQEIANVIGGKLGNASKWFAALPKELR